MARGSSSNVLDQESKAGSFFMATLVMWAVSVLFEIVFNKRTVLLLIVAGFCFYQFSNWLIRNYLSRDPLFVNTSVSLLHSFITSVTGYAFGEERNVVSAGQDSSVPCKLEILWNVL